MGQDIDRRQPTAPTSSPTNGGDVRQRFQERLTMPEALDLVGKLIERAYPNYKVSDGYIGNTAALMLDYPKSIALACLHTTRGIVRTCKYPPTPAEIVKWCEADLGHLQRAFEYDLRSAEQLRERERIERENAAESPEHRAAVIERIRAQMAAAGMPFEADRKHAHGETPETVKAKLQLSDADWNALPDAPRRGDFWQGVRWSK